jgi:hypothetical protein
MMPPDVLDKFAKVLGLLSSDQDGERASAARKATEILKQFRMTWADVAEAMKPVNGSRQPRTGPSVKPSPDATQAARRAKQEEDLRKAAENRERQLREELERSRAAKARRVRPQRQARNRGPYWRDQVDELLSRWSDMLSDWEGGFLLNIRDRSELTVKQEEALTKIYKKVSSAASGWRTQ